MVDKMEILTMDELIAKSKAFYENVLGISISTDQEQLAVQSLMMPEYANNYRQKFKSEMYDHQVLATVGDAICGAYLMTKKFDKTWSKAQLTAEKDKLTNESLNKPGELLLAGHLFEYINDLKNENKKSYATAFEAVIGFLALTQVDAVIRVLDRYIDIGSRNELL